MKITSVNSIRNEVARSIRAVRACCFGRKCLNDCIRRMTTAAPVRRKRCAGAAVVAALVALWALASSANVICVWRQDHYECSGEGNHIDVYSGGEGEQPYVITNIVGTCTNCVAMSPDYVRQWKIDAKELLDFCKENCGSAKDFINDAISRIQDVCSDYPIYYSGFEGTSPNLSTCTNFLNSVGALHGPPANKAAKIVYDEMSFAPLSVYTARYRVNAYDGAAHMYNSICTELSYATNSLCIAYEQVEDVRSNCVVLYDMVDELSDEQCTAQWGSGSGGLTNQVSGNWCTYDQGEAIKQLLGDIKDWEERIRQYVSKILARAESIDENIKSALFTSYTHIPTEDQLGTTWQDLYLSGGNGNFPAYSSTNILARIELLVAGMSGVLTNSTEYTEAEEGLDDTEDLADDLSDRLNELTGDFDNIISEKSESSRNIGTALVRLYQTFREWSGAPFSTEAVINSYSVEFEQGKSLDVPAFAVGSKQVGWANTIRVICRNSMTVIWILASSWLFIGFQVSFWRWCGKYIKWLVELAQGLFA